MHKSCAAQSYPFFMGLGEYSPNDAINGDMGWKPLCVKQWSTDVLPKLQRVLILDIQKFILTTVPILPFCLLTVFIKHFTLVYKYVTQV
jgi:hypothetical protein